jgi:hypothetical protein
MKSNFAVVALALATYLPSISAQTVHYDELDSGDLSESSPMSFSLGVGTNTIAGTMSFFQLRTPSGEFERPVDMDPFYANLAPGTAITASSVLVSFSPLNSNTVAFEWNWNLTDQSDFANNRSTCYGLLSSLYCPVVSPAGGSLFSGGALGSPGYFIAYGGAFQPLNFGLDAGGSFRYSLSFEVAAIPEVNSQTLLIVGLISLLATIRVRRPIAEA